MSISDNEFSIYFWGVRGSIATPGPSTVRYGGNTPCVEMLCQGTRIIFDGGTGIRVLGQELLKLMPIEASIFFTHSHWDHVQGFPFFTPAFVKGNLFKIYGKVAPTGQTMQDRLEEQMHHPNFPVPLGVMASCLKFFNIEVPSEIDLGNGVTVETGVLNHPGEATGYRVTCGDRVAVYATDTEHYPDRIDANLVHLARDADVLILDATYSDEEYWSKVSPKEGWGHSTWQEAIKVAEAANVKTLVIFHHDPLHSDDYLDKIGHLAKEKFTGAVMAREGMQISIPIRAGAKSLVQVY